MLVTIQLTDEQLASLKVAEIGMLYKAEEVHATSPKEVATYLKHLETLKTEHTVVLTVNTRNKIINKHIVATGTLDSSLVHSREVFRTAILDNASKIILAHNHPSGDVTPSEEDIAVTKRVATAGKILGISVLDHIIIGTQGYYSLAEHGHI